MAHEPVIYDVKTMLKAVHELHQPVPFLIFQLFQYQPDRLKVIVINIFDHTMMLAAKHFMSTIPNELFST